MLEYKNKVVLEDLALIYSQTHAANSFHGKTVLITGATGMLATYCIYYLLYLNDKYDADITIIGLARNKKKADERFKDICDRSDFSLIYQDITEKIEMECCVDYIFHMAGSASAYAIVADPIGIITANVQGTINVMELAKSNSGCRVILASTREVYGIFDASVSVVTEDMVGNLNHMQPRACYPESKRLAENICANYGANNHADFVIARIAHAFGPGMALSNDGRIMADLLCNVIDSHDIILKSDGQARRAFCYISDAVTALILLALAGENGQAYNVANETEEISIKSLASLLCEQFANGKIKVVHVQMTEKERGGYLNTTRVRLSTSKLEALGWFPQVELNTGIKNTLAVQRENT